VPQGALIDHPSLHTGLASKWLAGKKRRGAKRGEFLIKQPSQKRLRLEALIGEVPTDRNFGLFRNSSA